MHRTISRRTLLRNTAALTTGVVAASAVRVAAETDAGQDHTPIAPDHDAATGEIVDRDRHHHWDTV